MQRNRLGKSLLILGSLVLLGDPARSFAATEETCRQEGSPLTALAAVVREVAPVSRVLNVGSGSRPLPGATNLDIEQFYDASGKPLVDVQADATNMPEIPSGSYTEVVGTRIPSPIAGMRGPQLAAEVYRVLAPGGKVRISCATPGAFRAEVWTAAGFHDVRILGGTIITAVK